MTHSLSLLHLPRGQLLQPTCITIVNIPCMFICHGDNSIKCYLVRDSNTVSTCVHVCTVNLPKIITVDGKFIHDVDMAMAEV